MVRVKGNIRVRDLDLVVFTVTAKGIGFVGTNRHGTRGWVFFTSLDYIYRGMLSLANLEAMRTGKYLYAGTLTPRIREKRGGANEESCVSIASERLYARDALSNPGLCNSATCLANAWTHAFTQLREVHILFYGIIIFRYFILITIFIFNLVVAIYLIFSKDEKFGITLDSHNNFIYLILILHLFWKVKI